MCPGHGFLSQREPALLRQGFVSLQEGQGDQGPRDAVGILRFAKKGKRLDRLSSGLLHRSLRVVPKALVSGEERVRQMGAGPITDGSSIACRFKGC